MSICNAHQIPAQVIKSISRMASIKECVNLVLQGKFWTDRRELVKRPHVNGMSTLLYKDHVRNANHIQKLLMTKMVV